MSPVGDSRSTITAAVVRPFLVNAGYTGSLLQGQFLLGTGQSVPLVGFAHSPADARTACVAVVEAEIGTSEFVAQFRPLATPVVFVCGRQGLEWWQQSAGRPVRATPPIPPHKLPDFFASHAHDFSPDAIYRAKTWGRFDAQFQRRFIDLGLMPLVEAEIGRELEQLIIRNVQQLKSLLNWEVISDKKGQWLLKSVFWLVSAKILRDKEVGRFAKLDLADVEGLLDAVAEHFGAVRIPIGSQRQRNALTQVASGIARFSSLQLATTESLAYVYENTLISKATRQSLGTHSTPSYLVDYIVGKLRPWIADIPLEHRNVFEPACGHAAFLVSAMRLLTELLPGEKSSASRRRTYLRTRIHGCDVDDFALEIARLSLSLTDIPNPDGWDLKAGDMFVGNLLERQSQSATVLLANPPFENFGTEARRWYGKSDVTLRHINKTAEMLSRVLPELPSGAVLGVVVPQGFLHSRNAKDVRRQLVEEFELQELCLFPDKVFTFSEMESAVILARKRTRQRASTPTLTDYRRVRERQMPDFRQRYQVTTASLVDVTRQASTNFDLRFSDLQDVWRFCASLPQLNEFASIGKGLQYKSKLPRHVETVSERQFVGAVRGFSRFEPGILIHEIPTQVWMSLNSDHIAVERHGTRVGVPQVIFNEIRTSRSPWRLKALLDPDGHAVTGSFNVARSRGDVTLEWLWAIVNSPVGNAFAQCMSDNKHNQAGVFRTLPVPRMDSAEVDRITFAAREYLSYVRPKPGAVLIKYINPEQARSLLLRVDREVLKAYCLPAELEWQLLDYFSGWTRGGLPFDFVGYFPKHFSDKVSLADYFAITADWPTTNRRREALIKRKVGRTITAEEQTELAHLQSLATSRVRLLAPLPVKQLEGIHREVVGELAE